MKKRILFTCHLVAALLISTASASHAQDECKKGSKQSPINIDTSKTKKAKFAPITFSSDYKTITIPSADREYTFKKFHFHAFPGTTKNGGEHTINGRSFAMELHLVYASADGSEHGVVAILFERGSSNQSLNKFLETKKSDALLSMIGSKRNYYEYEGSLTTSPFSECVTWFVMATPQSVTQAQINSLSKATVKPNRALQSINSREVYKY